jgi:hypothetical protein
MKSQIFPCQRQLSYIVDSQSIPIFFLSYLHNCQPNFYTFAAKINKIHFLDCNFYRWLYSSIIGFANFNISNYLIKLLLLHFFTIIVFYKRLENTFAPNQILFYPFILASSYGLLFSIESDEEFRCPLLKRKEFLRLREHLTFSKLTND